MLNSNSYKKRLLNLYQRAKYVKRFPRQQIYKQNSSPQLIKRQDPLISYINSKINEPVENLSEVLNKKLLVIIACHTDSKIKFEAIINNLKYFKKSLNTDIFIVNTLHLAYSSNLKNLFSDKCFYHEIENAKTFDFGKWMHAVENIDYISYDNVIFTNDSFIIHANIDRFLYNAVINNSELYGYNDSTQDCYHYQSYLFRIKSCAIQKFIDMYESQENNIASQYDVIHNYELKMTNFFDTRDCYLKIGNIPFHKGRDIFFTNDYLYFLLKKSGLLPFTKIKRIL